MKRRFFALLLTAAMLLTAPALAAPAGLDHFVRTRTYEGQFSDLTADSTFYPNVTALYEYGLSVGKGDGTFGLQDPMTVGQIVIFAGRVRSLYQTGDPEKGPGAYAQPDGRLSQGYLRYLQAEGVLGTELDGALTANATRAQVAHVLAGVLPEAELPAINQEAVTVGYATRRFITDVDEYTPYAQDILALYRAGISSGSDGLGTFHPEAEITRGAAAAMLTRLVDPGLRVVLDWDISEVYPTAQGATLAGLVPPGEYIAAPETREEFDQAARYMLSGNSDSLTLQYPGLTPEKAKLVMEQTLAAVKTYCEQCYNTVECSYTWLGRLDLHFSAASLPMPMEELRDRTLAHAVAVHDWMWESGQINAGMSEYEKARVYYTWICDNCVYDYGADEMSVSHIAYSLFENGSAVCDGYVGAYNMLLKLEGIQCTALANSSHIWTVALLDGQEVHIDPTWGDSRGTINYYYFAMTPQESWAQHQW